VVRIVDAVDDDLDVELRALVGVVDRMPFDMVPTAPLSLTSVDMAHIPNACAIASIRARRRSRTRIAPVDGMSA